MKNKKLLQSVIITITLFLNFNLFAQSIDSCIVLSLNSPPSVHVYCKLPHDGFEFTHFETDFINGNDHINLFFTECYGSNVTTFFDTIYTPSSSWTAVPDTILVSLHIDSNTVDSNCVIHPTITTTDILTIDVTSFLEIPDEPINYFTLFPNPASTELHLTNLLEKEVEHINLYSSTGKLVKTYSPTLTILSLNGLISGYYFLEIETDENISRKKIIIK